MSKVGWFWTTGKKHAERRKAFYSPLVPLMRELADAGMTPYGIARELEKRGVKTFQNGHVWDQSIIRRLLEPTPGGSRDAAQ